MREPRAPLALVHAELLEPCLQVVRERRGATTGIVEDEHPDAARLAVSHRREPDPACARSRFAQHSDDRVELLCRPVSEKSERDVQVIARDDPHALQLGALPRLDLVESVAGKPEREEEPQSFIAVHARRRRRTPPSRLRAGFQKLPQEVESGHCRSGSHLLAVAGDVERSRP